MGLFDWLGPTSLTKRRGWDALPAPATEMKAAPHSASSGQAPSGPGPITLDGRVAFWTPTMPIGSLYRSEYGSAGNSAVFACLQAIATAIAEPDLRVYRTAPHERVELDGTPLGDLLARPNPHFSMDTLLAYLSTCLHVDGNAYWRKLRAGNPETGNVVELWPISPTKIEPVTTAGSPDFVSFYRYWEGSSRPIEIAPEQIVHFRSGLDDADHRLGCAPLKHLVREISSDDQATRYADRLLANLAINGLTLSFDKDAPAISQAVADEMKVRIQAAYGGDNAGGAAVLSPGATLTALGFSPEQMDLKVLHRVPEERISAVLGVPAIVAGLGAGLDRSTFANVREAREMFTEAKLIPLWRSIASEITQQVLPDFISDTSAVVDFDISEIRALADDQNAAAIRLKTLVEAGIISADEARAELGLEPGAPAPSPAVVRLPAAASRRELRALPARSVKAAEDLPGRYEDLRADELPSWEAELVAFLEAQLRRVTRRLRAGADTATDLVTEGEAILLGETLTPLQIRVLGQVSRLVVAELGVDFVVDDPATRAFLEDCGVHIVGITDTTRSAVQEALIAGQAEGEGIEQLASRLRGLPAFGDARARVIARTELGHATSTASLASYRATGVVVGVRVMDGDADAACAAMDGRTFALGQEPAALEHPNCVRAFAPIVDADELTRSA